MAGRRRGLHLALRIRRAPGPITHAPESRARDAVTHENVDGRPRAHDRELNIEAAVAAFVGVTLHLDERNLGVRDELLRHVAES